MVCALFAATCYGVAASMQAVAARGTRDDRQGIDPRLLFRLLGQWRYLLSLVLDVIGLVAQVTALRSLPLFLVQAAMAASIVVTALLAIRWFGMRMSAPEWGAVAVVCVGLAMLGAAAQSEGAKHGSDALHWGLLAAALFLAALGMAAGRLPDGPRTALLGLISGLGFGTMGICIRVLPSLDPVDLIRDPATYAAIIAGVQAGLFLAAALQRGGVVAATAMMLIGETVPPSAVGVILLGDHTRPGWAPVAAAGFVIAVAGAVVLARFGDLEKGSPAQPQPAAGALAGAEE